MKALGRFTFFISLLILVSVSSSDVDDVDENTSETNSQRFLSSYKEPNEKIGDMTFSLFGMKWSAKYYNPHEYNYFHLMIPTDLHTVMKVDPVNNIITANFTGAKNSIEQFNKVKVEARNSQRISFSKKVMKFYDGYTRVELNLNLMNDPDYELSSVNIYHNSILTSVRIKITDQANKIKRALFVEFDFSKYQETEPEVDVFVKYLKSLLQVKNE